MRLYSYSNETHTFVEVRWVAAKFAIGGLLMGLLLLGIIKLNQSVANALGSRSVAVLATENDILRRQLTLISPRVTNLEMQSAHLDERVNNLHTTLLRRKLARETVWRFANAAEVSKRQSVISVRAGFRP